MFSDPVTPAERAYRDSQRPAGERRGDQYDPDSDVPLSDELQPGTGEYDRVTAGYDGGAW